MAGSGNKVEVIKYKVDPFYLENKLINFPADKKEYMLRVLSEKKLENIKENFNYVSEMFDKKEEDEMVTLKESATVKTKNVDVTAPEEVVTESKSFSTADNYGSDYVAKAYVTEFTKKLY